MEVVFFFFVFASSFQLYCQSFEIKVIVLDNSSNGVLSFAHLYSPNNFGTIAV